MKKLITVLVLGISVLGISALTLDSAWAHGGVKPKHGGVVQATGDLSFELTTSNNGVTIHVEDHGKPLDTAGMTGKLTVLNGSERTEAALKPAGENRLEANGVKVGSGTRAVAALTSRDGTAISVRFSIK